MYGRERETLLKEKGDDAMKKTIFLLFAFAAVPSFAQTCGHNCFRREAEPERRVQTEQRRPEPEFEERRPEPKPEDRPEYRSHEQQPEDRPFNNVQPRTTNVFRPAVVTPALSHAMTYNTRPGGIHIDPGYFAEHYGDAHGFHCTGDCGFRAFGGEWYFNFNGGWFGVMGQLPGNWALQSDYLYVGIGDDGNYYLYDAQFPDLAVQLTFVQNIGDDQAGTN
jgi:hypothetical protein